MMQEPAEIIRNIPFMGSGRSVQENIPAGKSERNRLLVRIQDYARNNKLTGPLSLDELRRHAQQIIGNADGEEKYRNYIVVLRKTFTYLRGKLSAHDYESGNGGYGQPYIGKNDGKSKKESTADEFAISQ